MLFAARLTAVVIWSGVFAWGQSVDPSLCQAQKSCGECQTVHPLCHWCSDVPFEGKPRCDSGDNLLSGGCQDVVNVSSSVRIKEARPFSDDVKMTPQRVLLFAYKNRPISFRVQIKAPTTRKLTLRVRNPVEFADISISSDCRRARGTATRLTCPNVQVGEVVEFIVTVNVKYCQEDKARINLKASNVRGRVRIDLMDLCTCGCEFYSVWASSESDEYCSDNGEILCGLCHCYPGYNGDRCECVKSDEYNAQCTPDGGDVCSGRGECICGECSCSKISTSDTARYSSQFCECDRTSCPEFNGELCGGSSRGTCACGQCYCRPDYEGSACERNVMDTANCVSLDGMLCNDHGRCVDGQCQCDAPWQGPTCGDCSICQSRCVSLRTCVGCKMFGLGPLSQEECQVQCASLDMIFVDNFEEINVGTQICNVRGDDDAGIQYAYFYNEDGSMHILVNRHATI